jgi:hypothetical protein
LLIAAVEAPPVPSRQSEHVNVRLVQLDVAIDTSRMTPLRALTASDLELSVDGREITDFYLDSTCTPSRGTEQPTAGESAGEPPAPALQRTAIVFFFDQAHLTLGGRELAIELAKSLVSRLIVHGARGSLVSSGSQLQTIVPLTDDPSKLIAGIDAMRNDTRLFDSYGMTEGRRVDEVVWLRQADEEMARMCARMYAREEVSKARETQGQLVVTLDGLAELPPPKAVVYFGDMLRQKAGLHYYHLLGGDAAAQGPVAPTKASSFEHEVTPSRQRQHGNGAGVDRRGHTRRARRSDRRRGVSSHGARPDRRGDSGTGRLSLRPQLPPG